eukprot:sb/3478065/
MCSLSSYDTDTTTVDGEGIATISGGKYLKVGYDVKITCTKSDYGLPDGADASHECETEGSDITITSCLNATLMLPYGSSDKVVCGDDGKFPAERPACVGVYQC